MNELPWYKSGILIANVVGAVTALAALLGIVLDFDVTATVTAIFAGVGALVSIYTFVKRLWSPSPNLTATASAKEAELVASGKIPVGLATNNVVNK